MQLKIKVTRKSIPYGLLLGFGSEEYLQKKIQKKIQKNKDWLKKLNPNKRLKNTHKKEVYDD